MTNLVTVRGALRVSSNGSTLVEFDRQSGCARCAQKPVCGSHLVEEGLSAEPLTMHAAKEDVGPARSVEAAIAGSELLNLTAICYLLPALLLVSCAWLASALLPLHTDIAAVFGAGIGVAISIGLLRQYDVRQRGLNSIIFRKPSGYNS